MTPEPLASGTLVWVVAEAALYYLDRDSTATVDPPSIIATVNGAGVPGRWIVTMNAAGATGPTGATGQAGTAGATGPTGSAASGGNISLYFGADSGAASGDHYISWAILNQHAGAGGGDGFPYFVPFAASVTLLALYTQGGFAGPGDPVDAAVSAVLQVDSTDSSLSATIPNGQNHGSTPASLAVPANSWLGLRVSSATQGNQNIGGVVVIVAS